MSEENDPGISVRRTEPVQEKRDKKPLLIALGLAGFLAVVISLITYRLVAGPMVRTPDGAAATHKPSTESEIVATGLGPKGATSDRINVDAEATDFMAEQAVKVFGGDASDAERKEFFDEVLKSTAVAQVIDEVGKNGTGKLALKRIKERLKGSADFQQLANQLAAGGLKGGRGPGGADPHELEEALESALASAGGSGAGRKGGLKGRFAGAQAGQGAAVSALAQELRRHLRSRATVKDKDAKGGEDNRNVQVSLNRNQWAAALAKAGLGDKVTGAADKKGSVEDFGFTADAWVWLPKVNRDKLIEIETEGHNQPGPPPPAVGTCSGTWCHLKSCGKGCVYCWAKYPWGCGGPTWDVNDNHDQVKEICQYFGFAGECKKACDDHPPCQWWTKEEQEKAKEAPPIGPAMIGSPGGEGGPETHTETGEACVVDCDYPGPLPQGCEWDPSCPQAQPQTQ